MTFLEFILFTSIGLNLIILINLILAAVINVQEKKKKREEEIENLQKNIVYLKYDIEELKEKIEVYHGDNNELD